MSTAEREHPEKFALIRSTATHFGPPVPSLACSSRHAPGPTKAAPPPASPSPHAHSSSLGLGVNRVALSERVDQPLDSPRADIGTPGGCDPVEDGVPVRLVEPCKGFRGPRVGGERSFQVVGDLDVGGTAIGGFPGPIGLGSLHRTKPGWTHPTFSSQSLDDRDVALRPGAACTTRGESSPEGAIITTGELPVDPAAAKGFLEGLVVGERGWARCALLGEDQPDTL